MDLVPIGEAARRLGVNASALRYYEERGLVHPMRRGGRRVYTTEELIALARGAQKFLTHAVNCPAEHPVGECPDMISSLDRLLAGVTFEELAAEHA